MRHLRRLVPDSAAILPDKLGTVRESNWNINLYQCDGRGLVLDPERVKRRRSREAAESCRVDKARSTLPGTGTTLDRAASTDPSGVVDALRLSTLRASSLRLRVSA